MTRDIIDLTIDSDSDVENRQSPSRTLLASFQSRKCIAGVQPPFRSSIEHTHAHFNGHSQHAAKKGSILPLSPSGSQNTASVGVPRALLSTEERLRQERVEKNRKFNEHRHLGGLPTKPRTVCNAAVKQRDCQPNGVECVPDKSLPNGPVEDVAVPDRTGSDLVARAVGSRDLSISDHTVLAGSGLMITRSSDQDSSPVVAHDGLKRPYADHETHKSSASLAKKPRTSSEPDSCPRKERRHHQKRPVYELLEDTAPETFWYSPEAPVAKAQAFDTVHEHTTPNLESNIQVKPSVQSESKGFSGGPNKNGLPYSPEEDALLKRLKEEDGLAWDEIMCWFNGRTRGSLQVRYSTKLGGNTSKSYPAQLGPSKMKRMSAPGVQRSTDSRDTSPDGLSSSRPKRITKTRNDTNMVSWKSLSKLGKESAAVSAAEASPEASEEPMHSTGLETQDRTDPSSVSRILRQRELGSTSQRAWSNHRTITEELKNHVFNDYGLVRRYHGTSGDVVSLSWSSNGTQFAAGSIAITDSRSMQYNMQRNLLFGDLQSGELQELVEHHVSRPTSNNTRNVNSLLAMRASQDHRLFMTVTATGFSPNRHRLYTTGTDRMLRYYSTSHKSSNPKCHYAVEHPASIDLLAIKADHGLVATGCHAQSDSIRLYRCHTGQADLRATLTPHRHELQSKVDIYPSALKWGTAPHHQNYLLAGFSGDEEKQLAGETCLWDGERGRPLTLGATTRNVFDVAWNSNASHGSISFAVAANPSGLKLDKGMRTAVHCFSPHQHEARRILALECPAADINDLTFCPHDENLIATGATDGNVYVWDIRSNKTQQPLHTLHHGASENVLAHDRDKEVADTGVRLLSWGATKSRLYSGSSDGIVKVWNPYRSPENAHFEDLCIPSRQRAAIMSGAFSPDYSELLIGTENGQINQFSLGREATYRVQPFTLKTAPPRAADPTNDSFVAAHELMHTGQVLLRPCGAMPFKQAVQGPNYTGPFLAPPDNEVAEAEQAHEQACQAQHDAYSKFPCQVWFDLRDKPILKANRKVRKAQQRLEDLSDRLKHFTLAQRKAESFQRSLREAEQARKALEAQLESSIEPCTLDCRVLPNEDEPEDSGRSDLRIPGMLRQMTKSVVLSKDDLSDPACISCFPATRRKDRTLCASCKLTQARLNTSCSGCAGPARIATDGTQTTVCEHCSFSCFRCSGRMQISNNLSCVSCHACELQWEAGVLGYELVRGKAATLGIRERSTDGRKSHFDRKKGLGAVEMEHYASLWQDAET